MIKRTCQQGMCISPIPMSDIQVTTRLLQTRARRIDSGCGKERVIRKGKVFSLNPHFQARFIFVSILRCYSSPAVVSPSRPCHKWNPGDDGNGRSVLPLGFPWRNRKIRGTFVFYHGETSNRGEGRKMTVQVHVLTVYRLL